MLRHHDVCNQSHSLPTAAASTLSIVIFSQGHGGRSCGFSQSLPAGPFQEQLPESRGNIEALNVTVRDGSFPNIQSFQFLEAKSRRETAVGHAIFQRCTTPETEILQLRNFGKEDQIVSLEPVTELHSQPMELLQVQVDFAKERMLPRGKRYRATAEDDGFEGLRKLQDIDLQTSY